MVVPPAFNRTEANVADDPTPTITEQERKTLDEHQFALSTAAEAVKNGVANYNACLAELQEVAAPIVARLRADYGAGSPASVSLAALIGDLEAIASMKALTSHSLG
jgi:mevalonate kinase